MFCFVFISNRKGAKSEGARGASEKEPIGQGERKTVTRYFLECRDPLPC